MMRKPTPLKLAIVARSYKQADLAQAAGMSESRLSRLVNGRVKPYEYELKHLAKVLGVEKEALR